MHSSNFNIMLICILRSNMNETEMFSKAIPVNQFCQWITLFQENGTNKNQLGY